MDYDIVFRTFKTADQQQHVLEASEYVTNLLNEMRRIGSIVDWHGYMENENNYVQDP
ncbi:hypothetical protein [Paenibacillus cremeus]|uniref:hypothetical protein n=1 Tax=Paenibacillus cremeus TaxID=2163881 RepID=UPI0016481B2B|nr:hypothetical protein [Paenibacillus cremeus]